MDAKRFDGVRCMPGVTVPSTVRTAFPECGPVIVAMVFIQALCGGVQRTLHSVSAGGCSNGGIQVKQVKREEGAPDEEFKLHFGLA